MSAQPMSGYSSSRLEKEERHDGPNLHVGKGSGALTSCACSCGWRVQRFGPCRVPLVRAWHAHVLASRAAPTHFQTTDDGR